MKCIRCQKDSNYKDRTNRKCPGCKGEYAFEPKLGDPITDMLFFNAIQAVSGEGRIRWGVEHLYYEICRRKKKKSSWLVLLILAFVSLVIAVAVNEYGFLKPKKATLTFLLYGLPPILIFAAVVSFAASGKYIFVSLTKDAFNTLWIRWQAVHGTPQSAILRAPEPDFPKDLESDIGDYSFDRAVICDRARTVDLLVANNFHFENNCAILSINGYPKKPFEVIRRMLKKNPKLQVYVVHDATPDGCRLAQRLIDDEAWFGGAGLRMIDLGLRPRHSKPLRGLFIQPDGAKVQQGDGISSVEATWLTEYRLELASIRPENIIKRVFAGLQAHANDDPRSGDTGGGGSVTECGAFDAGGYGGDAGGMDGGGGDAFG